MNIARRFIRLFLPDYGHTPNITTAPSATGQDVGEELPWGINGNAAMSADYQDHVIDIEDDAHVKARKCLPVSIAVEKAAAGIAKLDWQVRGGNPARAEWVKKKLEHSLAFYHLLENCVWAKLEGARYHQLKPAPARSGDMTVSWDFEHGARIKEKAGGTIHNDGVNLYEVRRGGATEQRTERLLDHADFLEFRPGLTPNPEGNTTLGMSLAPLVAAWHDGLYRAKQNAKVASLPATIVEHDFRQRRPSTVSAAISANVTAIQQAQSTGGVVGLSAEAKAKILQPAPGMLADLWVHLEKIVGMVYQAILHNSLTTTTSDSGPAGSSKVHMSEEDKAILVLAMQIADAFNKWAVPALFRWNDGFDVPPLNDGEEEVYFWPEPPKDSDAGEINSSDKDHNGSDDVPATPEEREANMALIALRQIVQRSKRG